MRTNMPLTTYGMFSPTAVLNMLPFVLQMPAYRTTCREKIIYITVGGRLSNLISGGEGGNIGWSWGSSHPLESRWSHGVAAVSQYLCALPLLVISSAKCQNLGTQHRVARRVCYNIPRFGGNTRSLVEV